MGLAAVEGAGVKSRVSAGLLLYRMRQGQLEVFLAHPGGPFFARKDEGHWTIPKGEVHDGEDLLATAIREVHEETGVWASIGDDLGPRTLVTPDGPIKTQFFLMRRRGRGLAKDARRKRAWLTLDAAKRRANFDETRELLAIADQRRRAFEAAEAQKTTQGSSS